ncbi:polysaccharide lyase family 14 protein [Coprinopsis marcescibilis]|uniref:Polysaccharide lyase family 14 protein n=1 Tax=Coprinopsis marcescibilis TaxID=230819 RepID=A0A5C3KQJ7_COPMA|nr:polysaccharide lyase family 14 protein [Coprinopsis marcescibilis]
MYTSNHVASFNHTEVLVGRAPANANSLFPRGRGSSSWTTFSGISGARTLNWDTLKPVRVSDRGINFVQNAPSGKGTAIKINYPKGSYKPSAQPRGGISFYSHGPGGFDFTSAREATFSYSIYFPSGFDWVKGGKLPGLFGGDNQADSYSCSGGRKSDECWSARLMWRSGGNGELYAYVPPNQNKALCKEGTCEYGMSIGRGNFKFPTNQWVTVAERIRLNDVGQKNGEMELYFDGQSRIKVTNAVLRTKSAGKIRGIFFESFFGGSDASWATPKNQDIFIADLSVAITQTFSNAKRSEDESLDEEEEYLEVRSSAFRTGVFGWVQGFALVFITLLLTEVRI